MADVKLGPGVKAQTSEGGKTFYTNAAGDRVKADGSPIAKRGEGKGAQPRPAYLIYEAVKGPDGQFTGDVEILSVTRKSDELLTALDENRNLKYKKVLI
jgi:hypothetical protein